MGVPTAGGAVPEGGATVAGGGGEVARPMVPGAGVVGCEGVPGSGAKGAAVFGVEGPVAVVGAAAGAGVTGSALSPPRAAAAS